jgi:hypothetical protein
MKKLTQYNVKFTFTTISGKIVEEIVSIAAIDSDNAKRIVSAAYKQSMISINISSVGSNGMLHVEDPNLALLVKHPHGLSDLDMVSNKIEALIESSNHYRKLNTCGHDEFYRGEESALLELKTYVEKLINE